MAKAQSNQGLINESIITLENSRTLFPKKELAINYELARNHYEKKVYEQSFMLLEKVLADKNASE